MPNLSNHYPDGYHGPRIKIKVLECDIIYLNTATNIVTWCTLPFLAKAIFDFEPETFEEMIRDRKLGSGYYAIDHIRRKTVGRAWDSWNDLAMELVNRGLAEYLGI